MPDIIFEWDERKNVLNKRKHGVPFEEDQTTFADEKALLLNDPEHSREEERYILLGLSSKIRLLVVCHCYRKNDRTIRIISARKASRLEQKDYLERWQ